MPLLFTNLENDPLELFFGGVGEKQKGRCACIIPRKKAFRTGDVIALIFQIEMPSCFVKKK